MAESELGDVTEQVYLHIGRFIIEFSQLENAVRLILADTLNLGSRAFDPISASLDFATLCRLTQALYESQSKAKHKDVAKLKTLITECLDINNHRVRIVHGTWISQADKFQATHISRQSLKKTTCYETIQKIENIAERAAKLRIAMLTYLFASYAPPLGTSLKIPAM